jgi:ABC-type sugar transport system ATPase subunit
MEVYRNPVSSFVATFLGTSNLLEATVRGGMAIVDGVAFLGLAMAAGLGQAGPATLSFRPEDLVAGPGPADDCAATVDGRLVFRRDLGATSELHVAWGGRTLVALAPAAAAFAPGGELRLGFRHGAGRLLAR